MGTLLAQIQLVARMGKRGAKENDKEKMQLEIQWQSPWPLTDRAGGHAPLHRP